MSLKNICPVIKEQFVIPVFAITGRHHRPTGTGMYVCVYIGVLHVVFKYVYVYSSALQST